MDCTHIREALSARLDGEDDLPVDRDRLDSHLAGCPTCTTWLADVAILHRLTRVRAAERVPDLSSTILARVGAAAAPRRRALVQPISAARWGLCAVAVAQLVVAGPAVFLGEGSGATGHVARELGSFDVALAVGLLVAAWQPARAWGLLPVGAALGFVMGATAALDVVDGSASTSSEAHHLLDLAAIGLLWLIARAARTSAARSGLRWSPV